MAAAEARRIKEEKELEIQRLRELQERAADRQGEIDALRAKRAFEEGERKARREEKEKAELARRQAKDLDIARRKQFVEREVMLASQAKAERDEFLRIIQKQKEQEDEERSLEQQRHGAFRNHAQTIRDQIGMNGEVRKQERLDYLVEGRKVRQRIEDERLKVERIKKSKLDGLVGLGIEGKYQADLSKKRIL
jgi:hypothetical protein